MPVFWSFWKKEKTVLSLDALNNIVSKRQAEAEEYEQNKYFQEAKIQAFLFSENINNQKKKRNLNIINALSATTANLNQELSCDLSELQISAILLEIHPLFLEHYYENKINKREEINFPDSKTINKICERILRCKTRENQFRTLNIDRCKAEIYGRFEQYLASFWQKETIETAALWNNKYQNGDVHDAQFDLLHDMSQVGKVFFESFRSAPEIVYYQMPLFNKRNEYLNTTPSKSTVQNQNSDSPRKNLAEGSRSEIWKQSSENEKNKGNKDNPESKENKKQNNEIQIDDPEIDNFINKNVETAYGNDLHLLFQNQCIPIAKTQENKKSNTLNPQSSPLKEQANTNENNLQLQQNQFKNLTSPNLQKERNQNINWWNTSTKNTDSQTTSLENEKKLVQQCKEKCEAKDKNWKPHYAPDEQAICLMQCLCGEYRSPELPDATEITAPILEEGALRIRFCTIPAEFADPKTWKKSVSNISTILNQVHQVTASLYHGGRLSVQKIPKEALDSKHLNESRIADSLSFNLNISTKNNPKVSNKTDQERVNKLFFDTIQNNTKPITRNSFVVLALGNQKENEKNSVKNLDVPSIPKDSQQKTDLENTKDTSIRISLYNQNTANQSLFLQDWLTLNQKFLDAMNEQLKVDIQTVQALGQKK